MKRLPLAVLLLALVCALTARAQEPAAPDASAAAPDVAEQTLGETYGVCDLQGDELAPRTGPPRPSAAGSHDPVPAMLPVPDPLTLLAAVPHGVHVQRTTAPVRLRGRLVLVPAVG